MVESAVDEARRNIISSEDREFIDQCYNDYLAAKETKPSDDWQRYDDYIEDDQWETAAADEEWKPKPQINICWKILNSIHANMTSGKTSVTVTCRRPYYDDIAQKVSDITEYYWDLLDMDLKLSEVEWVRPKLGTAVLKVPWNPRLNDGDGDIDTEIVHPANFFPDSNVINPRKLQSAEFIDVVMPKTVKYILNNYSKEVDKKCKYTKEQLKQILIPESSFSDTEIYGDAVNSVTQKVPVSIVGTEKTYRSLNHREKVNLHEYWYRDDKNKLHVAWFAGWVLLKDTKEDKEMAKGFYEHGKYPFVVIPYVQKDKRLWGRSEFQSLVAKSGDRDGVQDIINKLVQDFLVNHRLVGQGQIVYQHGMVKNPEKLTGEAGLRIPVKGDVNRALKRLQGTPIPGVMEAIDSFLTHADRLTNLWDVTQGRSTPYTKTAQGTMALLEQAMRPQNDRVNTLNYGLREWAEIFWAHLTEFVTADREFVLDRDGQRVFDFNPSMLKKMPKRVRNGDEIVEDPDRSSELYFNFKFDVGASLAITKTYLIELGINLWGQKAVDIEGLYKLLPEFPGKQDTLERLKAASQQQPEQPGQEQVDPQAIQQFVQSLPPEIVQAIQQMPPEQQTQHVLDMMQMDEQTLQSHLQEMMQGAQEMPQENTMP